MFDQTRSYVDSAKEAEQLGKLESACALYKAALRQQQQPTREDMTISVLKSLGRIYLHQKRFKKAETIYRQLLGKLQRSQSELKSQNHYALLRLAEVCTINKKYRSAERYFIQGLAEFDLTMSDDDCVPPLQNLASMWSARKRADLANLALDAIRQKSIAAGKVKLSPSHIRSTGE